MTYPEPREYIKFPDDMPPRLIVTVDVEEEFDWSKPFSRDETGVTNVDELWRVQEIFDRHGVIPTYMIDYPVATTASSIKVIRDIYEDGRCQIGAQLHPWVTPPFDEEVCIHNSFPGNLERELEFEKLRQLTEVIEKNFGHRPTIYRAGRYGFGPGTMDALEKLGYEIDISVVPYTSFASEGGPDYTSHTPTPFWFGRHTRILGLPLTCGFSGALSGYGKTLFPVIGSSSGETLKMQAAAAHLGLLDRIRLSPEGMTLEEMKSVTRQLLNDGTKVFQFTLHSSTLKPGSTEYVKNDAERVDFLTRLDDFLAWFSQATGQPATLFDIQRKAQGITEKDQTLQHGTPANNQTSYSALRQYKDNNLIWLVGLPRSGTSWIGKVLDSHPNTLYRHEPDTELRPGDEFSLLAPVLNKEASHDAETFLNKVLKIKSERVSGKLPSFPKFYYSQAAYTLRWSSIYAFKLLARWGLRTNLPELVKKKHRSQVRLVWKSINGTGSLGAFASLISGCHVVHIVRHPCGHVASVLKGEKLKKFSDGTPASEDLGVYRLLAETSVAQKHDLTFEKFLQMAPIERITWRWALFNEKAFEEGRQVPNYTLVNYDYYCSAPESQIKTLFETLGLHWCGTTQAFLDGSIGVNDDNYYSLQKDPMTAANKWQNDLTRDEIQQISQIALQCEIGRQFTFPTQISGEV